MSGLIRFGVMAMDKKMVLIDLDDAQHTFYMDNMVTDWLGFVPASAPYDRYKDMKQAIQSHLPDLLKDPPPQWAGDDRPIVLTILDQRNIGEIARKFELIRGVIVLIFTFLMVLVLWNAGLLNGIHRYGEMGLRLAMGETHRHLVASLTLEAFAVGVIGSIGGCVVGAGGVLFAGSGRGHGRRLVQVGIDAQRCGARTPHRRGLRARHCAGHDRQRGRQPVRQPRYLSTVGSQPVPRTGSGVTMLFKQWIYRAGFIFMLACGMLAFAIGPAGADDDLKTSIHRHWWSPSTITCGPPPSTSRDA